MTPRERIKRILEFKKPDRIGMYDSFRDQTLAVWQAQGYPSHISAEEYFDFDFQLFNLDDSGLENKFLTRNSTDKFLTLSICGPFEAACRKKGRINFLKEVHRRPEETLSVVDEELNRIYESLNLVFQKGLDFDGTWVWSDLAYKDNLFFPPEYYKKWLFPVHKKLFTYLNDHGMPVIFHSDGKIDKLIPHLLKAGLRALHPLDSNAGIDMRELGRRYGKKMVFFGNIDAGCMNSKKDTIDEVKRKLKILDDGFYYIYHASEPIGPDITLKNYEFMLKTVKEFGKYTC